MAGYPCHCPHIDAEKVTESRKGRILNVTNIERMKHFGRTASRCLRKGSGMWFIKQ
jgi:hypothetical protein